MSQQARTLLSLPIQTTGILAQYRGVTFAGAQVAVTGAKGVGVSERPTTVVGEIALVNVKGTCIAEAGAAIAVGSSLSYDASGRVVTAGLLALASGAVAVTSSAANGAIITGGDLPQYIVGYALQPAAAAGDLIEIILS